MSVELRPCGPTAARRHGKKGKTVRPDTTTVDIHCHVQVPRADEIEKKAIAGGNAAKLLKIA